MSNRGWLNLAIAAGVAGIIFYLGEQDTTLVLIALAGLVYLYFFGTGTGARLFA